MQGNCNCSLSGGVCLPATASSAGNDKGHVVAFATGEVRSAFFQEHVEMAKYMCEVFFTTVSKFGKFGENGKRDVLYSPRKIKY